MKQNSVSSDLVCAHEQRRADESCWEETLTSISLPSFLQSLVCLHAFSEKPTGQSHKGTPSYLNGTQEEEKPSQAGERGRCKLASSTGGTSSSRTGQRGVARPTGAPPLLWVHSAPPLLWVDHWQTVPLHCTVLSASTGLPHTVSATHFTLTIVLEGYYILGPKSLEPLRGPTSSWQPFGPAWLGPLRSSSVQAVWPTSPSITG